MDRFQDAFRQLSQHAIDTRKLSTTQALLEWDQQTYLPKAGGEYRAEQISFLAGWIHRRTVEPRVAEWLEVLADADFAMDRTSAAGASIAEWRRQFEKQKKLPSDLVEELARACSLAQLAWSEARTKSDFSIFAPSLQRIVELKKQQADAWSDGGERYDGLLDEFEPHAKTVEIRDILSRLRGELVPLIQKIAAARQAPDASLLQRHFPRDAQEAFAKNIAARLGFDFSRGRLDTTRHPFCTGLGPNDCRITTRYDERFFSSSFFGTLHEAGHGMYEQGLPVAEYGLPSGDFCSLGFHESQSRLWENLVGRSRGFWRFAFPLLQAAFPEAAAGVTEDQWFAAANQVRPNLIRVEADEATYNLHIVIRFELEQELIDGKVHVSELPQAWNESYERYLGLRPTSDDQGVLQDIHWSAGLFGYFPTYALGNIFASQIFEQATRSLGDLSAQFARGDFQPLLGWLRENIHVHGHRFSSRELIQRIGGDSTDCRPLINHLQAKLFPIYGLST